MYSVIFLSAGDFLSCLACGIPSHSSRVLGLVPSHDEGKDGCHITDYEEHNP